MDLYLQGIAGAIAKLAALDPDVIDAAVASLVVSGAATGIAIVTGVPLGAIIGLTRFPGRRLILSLVNTGMGLPPVVVGLFVVALLYRSGGLGDSARGGHPCEPTVRLAAAAVRAAASSICVGAGSLGADRIRSDLWGWLR